MNRKLAIAIAVLLLSVLPAMADPISAGCTGPKCPPSLQPPASSTPVATDSGFPSSDMTSSQANESLEELQASIRRHAAVPEPTSLVLIGSGLIAIGAVRRLIERPSRNP